MSKQSIEDQYNMMLGMISRMSPQDQKSINSCLDEFRALAEKYQSSAVIALSVMSVYVLLKGEHHGKD